MMQNAKIPMEKELAITNSIEELTKLPSFVEDVCDTLGWGPEKVFNLNLVLEEALSNVVLYAYPEGEQHNIYVSAYTTSDDLVFQIKDTGKPFDPTQVPDVDTSLSAEERQIGGLGVFLIKQIMDRVEYQRQDGQNILTLTTPLTTDTNNPQ